MKLSKPFLISLLSFLCLYNGGDCRAQQKHCNPIDVSVDVSKESSGASIKLSLDVKENDVLVSLIKPNGSHIMNSDLLEFKGLDAGNYVLVVNGRKEQDNFCVTHKNITID